MEKLISGSMVNKRPTLSQRLINCNDEPMRLEDAANFLGKSKEAVKKMCQRGQIPARKRNNTWFLLRSEIIEWLRE